MPDANNYRDISVVIPVREGSSRVREKIFLPFDGEKTLLDWKIEQVKQVQDPDLIFVSSNSERVREAAERNGVRFMPRADRLCTSHLAPLHELIHGIVKDVKTPYFAWITVVVPLMAPDEYREAFDLFLRHVALERSHDSLTSVNLLKEFFWTDTGPLNHEYGKGHVYSQDLPNIYRITNGLYMRSVEETLAEPEFHGRKPYMYQVPKASGIDIDEYEDYEAAVAMKAVYGNRTRRAPVTAHARA
jgi:CMP-N-acetylneuraminic acid synthetase